jgi:predicted metal-dependent enzyme (double-stranded beta helix superfamily)
MWNPTEHLAVDKVMVLYKGRVIFQQYIPKKHKRFGIKIYKLCNSLEYTYDASVYLGKQRQHATSQITATHGTVLQVIQTSCSRLQCLHGVCGQVRQNDEQLWNYPENMEVDEETVFPPHRHDNTQRLSYS